jgi:transcriptional regulator with XRE-family HTH domain
MPRTTGGAPLEPELRAQLRTLRGDLSTRKFAAKIGRTGASIDQIERGEHGATIETLRRWAEAADHRLVITLVPHADLPDESEQIKAVVRQLPAPRRSLVLRFAKLVARLSDEIVSSLSSQIAGLGG